MTAQTQEVKINNNVAADASTGSNANSFYRIPLYSERLKVEKKSSDTNVTMRFITRSSVAKVVNFYKSNITEKYKIQEAGGSTIFSYKVGEFNKMIEIQDFFGKADVTLLSEK